jgi:hypothetical protein
VSYAILEDDAPLLDDDLLVAPPLAHVESAPQKENENPRTLKMLNLLAENFDFAYRSRVRDKKVTLRVNLIFANILVCVALGLLLMQLSWAARYEHFPGDPPNKCLMDDGTEKCLFDTSLTTAIKVTMSVLTIINEFQFVELLRARVHNQIEHLRDMQVGHAHHPDVDVDDGMGWASRGRVCGWGAAVP